MRCGVVRRGGGSSSGGGGRGGVRWRRLILDDSDARKAGLEELLLIESLLNTCSKNGVLSGFETPIFFSLGEAAF